jgi:hypothetical protein
MRPNRKKKEIYKTIRMAGIFQLKKKRARETYLSRNKNKLRENENKKNKKKRNRNERPTPGRYFLLPPVDCMPLSAAVLLKITISAGWPACAHLSSRKVTKNETNSSPFPFCWQLKCDDFNPQSGGIRAWPIGL